MQTSRFNGSRVGIVQFPGSNCDFDCFHAFRKRFGIELISIWHTETTLPAIDRLILPGGFSYGDYLRGGALASHSPIMQDAKRFAAAGGAILGICNGFQILTEAHLLPGVLLKNASRKFICRQSELVVASGHSPYHKALAGLALRLPIAHGEGRYYAEPETLERLRAKGQVLLRYADNPNGALDAIAGIVSDNGRVMGLMPHPERAVDSLLGGSEDGTKLLEAFLAS